MLWTKTEEEDHEIFLFSGSLSKCRLPRRAASHQAMVGTRGVDVLGYYAERVPSWSPWRATGRVHGRDSEADLGKTPSQRSAGREGRSVFLLGPGKAWDGQDSSAPTVVPPWEGSWSGGNQRHCTRQAVRGACPWGCRRWGHQWGRGRLSSRPPLPRPPAGSLGREPPARGPPPAAAATLVWCPLRRQARDRHPFVVVASVGVSASGMVMTHVLNDHVTFLRSSSWFFPSIVTFF